MLSRSSFPSKRMSRADFDPELRPAVWLAVAFTPRPVRECPCCHHRVKLKATVCRCCGRNIA